MNKEEKEQWLYEAYQYTSNFDFNRLDKYEEANDDICIDDLILDYTMLYEFHKEEIERLNNIINTILEFDFFKSNCPLDFSYTEKCDEDEAQNVFYEDAYCEENCSNEYKKCWLKYFEELQELKGSDKE